MAVITDGAPKEQFRLGMLWTDSRYRSVTIQIIALMLIMLGFAFLVNNAIENLAALGKDFKFTFLGEPASYDINQRLIEYTSRSTHARAALVGILNTLLLAFMGVVTATIIGVTAGVLRLSKNWLVSNLMLVYIEGVRNVPLLLQILLWYGIFIEVMPKVGAIRQAKIEAFGDPKLVDWATSGLDLSEAFVMINRGAYFAAPIFETGFGFVFSTFILGIIGAIAFSKYAKRVQEETGQHYPVFLIGLGLVVVPAVVMYFIMGQPLGIEYPAIPLKVDPSGVMIIKPNGEPATGFNYEGGIFARNSLMAMWFALSLYTGAFIAETVRAGIQSVSHGQTEAAFALGLRPNRTMNLIVLPQALRVIIPPLISQYLNLTKNTSLAIAVGYMDATGTLGGITLNQTGREMETIMLLLSFYLVVSLSISSAMNWYNNRVKLRER